MKMAYAFKGNFIDEPWESELFEDADDFDHAYNCATLDDRFNHLKKYLVYMHFEELQ